MLDEDIKKILEVVKKPVESATVECVASLFSVKVEIDKEFTVVDRLSTNSNHTYTIGNGNDLYQGLLVMGIDDIALSYLNESVTPNHDMKEAIGEVGNTLCGMIMDIKEFTNVFGILTQSVPQYTEGKSFFPKASAIEGIVHLKNGTIYMGYAIRNTSVENIRRS